MRLGLGNLNVGPGLDPTHKEVKIKLDMLKHSHRLGIPQLEQISKITADLGIFRQEQAQALTSSQTFLIPALVSIPLR